MNKCKWIAHPPGARALDLGITLAIRCQAPVASDQMPGQILERTMTYDVLVIIVALNVVATSSLWRKVATKSNRGPTLNKKAAAALWRSDPIVPRHDPPKTAGGEFSSLASESDRHFFDDFKDFADVINWWLADKSIASRFRLQDLPAGDRRLNVDYSGGPQLGRSFAIYYNQTHVGRLEIGPAYEYTTENPSVNTNIQIDWARLLGFYELTEFLDDIASHVVSADSQSDEYRNVRQNMLHALTRTLWDNYRISQYSHLDFEQWGELNVSFHGLAFFYFGRRVVPTRPRSR